jgi:hypothetical protein
METPLTQPWDSRLREAIRANSARVTLPDKAAGHLMELVKNSAIPGRGENYPI